MSSTRPIQIQPRIRTASSHISLADRWDHFLARWGVKRYGHRVEPGLYVLGRPDSGSPVIVSANYTLSFDTLRAHLEGIDCYILVLDTKGINVWCAAGKGTFSTDELVLRIEAAGLKNIVSHRVLTVPQLGATGVAAHLVRKHTGFNVKFGPVRATDLPEYLRTHQATPEMRLVTFPLFDRLALVPVELVKILIPMVIFSTFLVLVGDSLAAAGVIAAVLAGVILFPILLPWLPTKDFTTKGLILGGLAALPFSIAMVQGSPDIAVWIRAGWALIYVLVLPQITAFLALNFTGSTTFTSVSGVRREIYTYIPIMAYLFGAGFLMMLMLSFIQVLGGL